jgi:hypothetical protein|tara:strand:+ start:105 stop:581 length:477 start_codon:yes stop_codon:yes gene_type:complete
MFKKIIILILLGLMTSCGYEAQYSEKNLALYGNISIKSLDISGDRIVNIRIKNLLTNYSNIEKKQNFVINLKTESSKWVVSKDSKGDPLRYKIQIDTEVTAIRTRDNKEINLIFTKNYGYNNNGDVSALRETEREIKISLAEVISQELILRLVNFDDY